MSSITILAFIIGGLLGYFVFYIRFQNKDTVNNLRSNLKEVNKELQHIQEEYEEYSQQNIILKEEVTKLLEKNDDLTDVVTELSKYYVHIKKAAEKSTELNKYLQEPNSEFEEKMNNLGNKEKIEKSEKEHHKKFF